MSLELKLAASYYALDTSGQQEVKDFYRFNKTTAGTKKVELRLASIAQKRALLPAISSYYERELADLNPAIFIYLHPTQIAAFKEQLYYTYYLLNAQYLLHEAEKRRQVLNDFNKKIALCEAYIKALETNSFEKNQPSPESRWIGIKIAFWLRDKIEEIASGKTVVIKDWMTEVNNKRLYWVWGSSMMDALFKMIPQDFFHAQDAGIHLTAPDPIMGYMSWVLYYLRFGINLSLLIKHTIEPSINKNAEDNIPIYERFKTQWQFRKYTLLNDSIWGTANLICFFFCSAKATASMQNVGNILTVALLLMDLVLATWRFWEEYTQHTAEEELFKESKRELENLIANTKIKLNNNLDKKEEISIEIATYEAELAKLKKKHEKSDSDWAFKKYGLLNEWTYSLGLMVAFAIMSCFFIPSGLPIVVILVGATLCFALTALSALINGGLEIAKIRHSQNDAKKDCNRLLVRFNEIADEIKILEESSEDAGLTTQLLVDKQRLQKLLYLEMKGLWMVSDFQKRMFLYQIAETVRSTLIDALVPALVFVALVFMPIGIGIGVLAAGFALAALSNLLMRQFKPDKEDEKLPEFNNEEFEAFCASDKQDRSFDLLSSKSGFFYHKPKQIQDSQPDYIDEAPDTPDFGSTEPSAS